MPISRKRKKRGKKVKFDEGTRIVVDPNKESNVTMQDLINMVAYQEYKAAGVYDDVETPLDGTIVDADNKIAEENKE